MSDVVDRPRGVGAALRKRMRLLYRVLSVALAGVMAWAIAAPAYAASGRPSPHIYTIGRQSTLTGALIILVIAVVSIRRNLRRSPRIE